jgi:predicted lysophospholipase L1 biosynthesis ABC-type transport system permease subunit
MIRVTALAAPIIWFANQAAQFVLAPLACVWQSNFVLWIVFIAALALDAGCGVVAWGTWQRGNAEPRAAAMPPWLAMSGVILSISFFIIIAAQMIPALMLGWCA